MLAHMSHLFHGKDVHDWFLNPVSNGSDPRDWRDPYLSGLNSPCSVQTRIFHHFPLYWSPGFFRIALNFCGLRFPSVPSHCSQPTEAWWPVSSPPCCQWITSLWTLPWSFPRCIPLRCLGAIWCLGKRCGEAVAIAMNNWDTGTSSSSWWHEKKYRTDSPFEIHEIL